VIYLVQYVVCPVSEPLEKEVRMVQPDVQRDRGWPRPDPPSPWRGIGLKPIYYAGIIRPWQDKNVQFRPNVLQRELWEAA
jgi:hypothetical protein